MASVWNEPYFSESPKRYIVEANYENVTHSWIDYETDDFTEALNKLAQLQTNKQVEYISYTIFDRRTHRRIRITDVAMQS
jgi:hypothetical protein